MIRPLLLRLPASLLLGLILTTPAPAGSVLDVFNTNVPTAIPPPPKIPPPPVELPSQPILNPEIANALQDAKELAAQGKFDATIEKTTAVIQSHPNTRDAYVLRGNMYAEQKLWDLAEKDYVTALQIDKTDFAVKFNLAEIKFLQKNYDGARADFSALQSNPDDGDLAAYKVFLCDLFGGHQVEAQKELAVFNQAGANPSYYFGNLAWSLTHNNVEDARSWLTSAVEIYNSKKIILYGSNLRELGYLPLPPKGN